MGKDREIKLLELILGEVTAIRRQLDDAAEREAAAEAEREENIKLKIADAYGGQVLQVPKNIPARPVRSSGKSTISAKLYEEVLRASQPGSVTPEGEVSTSQKRIVHRKIWTDGTFCLEGRHFAPEENLQPGDLIYVRYSPVSLESYDQGFPVEYSPASSISALSVPVRSPHRTARMRRIRRLVGILKTSRNNFSPNHQNHEKSREWRNAHILCIGDEIPEVVLRASHFSSAQGHQG